MKKNLKNIVKFVSYYCALVITLLIVGRYLGFTPKQLNPIAWEELFQDYFYFIFLLPLFLILLGFFADFYSNKTKK